MPYEFRLHRQVEFSETDMAGIVHYSNFFRYMEAAEHAFLRSLGFSVVMDRLDPPIGWPRVHAECDYQAPLRFEDEIQIHLLVMAKKSKSLSYAFRIAKKTDSGWADVATGGLTVVCVTRDSQGRMASHPIPPEIASRIEVAPEEERAKWSATRQSRATK